jgi:2,3-bisphosphoglycerate-dependent phosphoglycerate mutase
MEIIKKILNDNNNFVRAWQLNERHYGALTGLNKIEMTKKIGEDKVYELRRSWDKRPDPLSKDSPYHPQNIETYKKIPKEVIPDTESLKDTYDRVLKYFKEEVQNELLKKNILITAHGNSIRALCKYLFQLDNEQISKLEIPTGNPLIIQFDEKLNIINSKYLDKERAKSLLVY